jgi:hypothetical protein
MSTITIDDVEYSLDSLSEEAKNQFASLQFVDQKLAQLNAEAAVYQTARIGYANALNAALPKQSEAKSKH